jgi:hypothetical protein
MACGVPAVTGDYAGATEFIPDRLRIKPIAFKTDGAYLSQRPIFKAEEWAEKILDIHESGAPFCLAPQYLWEGESGVWAQWAKWIREGL